MDALTLVLWTGTALFLASFAASASGSVGAEEKDPPISRTGSRSKMRGSDPHAGERPCGTICAAFPLCVMLHEKDPSVRNLVIILSTGP